MCTIHYEYTEMDSYICTIGTLDKERVKHTERERERGRNMPPTQFFNCPDQVQDEFTIMVSSFPILMVWRIQLISATERGVYHANVSTQCHEIVKNPQVDPATNAVSLFKISK